MRALNRLGSDALAGLYRGFYLRNWIFLRDNDFLNADANCKTI